MHFRHLLPGSAIPPPAGPEKPFPPGLPEPTPQSRPAKINPSVAPQEGKAQRLPPSHVLFRDPAGDIADPTDITGPLGHTDRLAGVKQVEGVRTFKAIIVSG